THAVDSKALLNVLLRPSATTTTSVVAIGRKAAKQHQQLELQQSSAKSKLKLAAKKLANQAKLQRIILRFPWLVELAAKPFMKKVIDWLAYN
ncbi:MAG: hypothetical protein HC803_10770, partial [Saprospiraceae bacterium]|nr:hypothetical protein [Saprospiraceae bacterium]